MFIHRTIGNKELWQREKTLFLTSRQAPIGCYGKVFQWVEGFDRFNDCAVCFNTSEFEEEVLKALLVCHVPTTLVVTGRFHDNYNVQIEQALKENRLLILVLQQEENDKGYTARLRKPPPRATQPACSIPPRACRRRWRWPGRVDRCFCQ